MKEQVYVPDPLNEQASTLVDVQTDIKTAVKKAVFAGKGREEVKKEITRIIDRAVARIRSPTLQSDARISLMRFADGVYERFTASLGMISPLVITSVIVLMRAVTSNDARDGVYRPATATERRAAEELAVSEGLSYSAYNKGLPLQEFHKRYISRIDAALETLARENALDPNDFTGRNSLRNLAEMQVRYERHQEEISGFKERGTRFVVCSVHADCSDRCAPWQGRVYSLDGTGGYTEDGEKFQPLENATDIYYTTKAGRTYKNGLLGFNCRHKLYEYKSDMVIPEVSAETQKREYAITKRQREMEREVISARELALSFKDANVKQYRRWQSIAKERYAAYREFSKQNDRAYYPDRIKIL